MVSDYLLIGVLMAVTFAVGILATLLVVRRDRKPWFESGYDRDGTLMMFILVGLLLFILVVFHSLITAHMVANLIGNVTGAILTAVAFIYKERGNGG